MRLALPWTSVCAGPISPPKASTSAWWPRQTPSVGTRGASRRTISTVAPGLARAAPGPGETTRCDGCRRSASSASMASFRRTTTSAPSSAEQVREVVGERVVVVDEKDHAAAPPRGRSRARARRAWPGTRRARRSGASRRRSRRPPAAARGRRGGRSCGSRCRCRACRPGARSRRRPRKARGGTPRARRSAASRAPSARPRPCRRGSRRAGGRTAPTPSASSPATSETRCVTCEKRSGSRKRSTRTVPGLQTRERSLRPRSTSITCSARSFSEESSRSASPSPERVVPAIGFRLARAALALDQRLGRGADQREPVELEQEQVRRGVHAPQRAVERERVDGRPAPARWDTTIWNASPRWIARFACSTRPLVAEAARASVRSSRARGRSATPGEGAPRRAVRRSRPRRRSAPRPGRARGRSGSASRDDEAALREVGALVGQRDRRLELGRVVVADVADHGLAAGLGLGEVDDPRAAADERVPPEPAALDRLEQEAGPALLAQPDVRPEGSDEIGVMTTVVAFISETKRPSGWKVFERNGLCA